MNQQTHEMQSRLPAQQLRHAPGTASSRSSTTPAGVQGSGTGVRVARLYLAEHQPTIAVLQCEGETVQVPLKEIDDSKYKNLLPGWTDGAEMIDVSPVETIQWLEEERMAGRPPPAGCRVGRLRLDPAWVEATGYSYHRDRNRCINGS